jgi:hypothetical protein
MVRFNLQKVIIIFVVLLVGCGSGREAPEGYVEACYGGDWKKYMVGESPIYTVTLDIDKAEWHKLTGIFQTYSNLKEIKFFDLSEESEGLSMLFLSLCSENGLWVHADKRIWSFDGEEDTSGLPLMVSVIVYANPEKWSQVSSEIDAELKKVWPKKVNSDHGIESSLRNSLM